MSTPEGRVKAKVKRALDVFGGYRFMPVQNGMGAPGLDFFCCINGMFTAIETKVPGKKLTPRQLQTATDICKAGGQVYVVRDDTDIAYMLRELDSPLSKRGFFYDTLNQGGLT